MLLPFGRNEIGRKQNYSTICHFQITKKKGKIKMKEYKNPEIEIIRFEVEDVTNTSIILPDIDGRSAGFKPEWMN